MSGNGRNNAVGGLFLDAFTLGVSWSEGLETTIGGFMLEGTIVAGEAGAVGGVVGELGCTSELPGNKVRLHDVESRVTIRPSGSSSYSYIGGIAGAAGQTIPVAIERCGFSGTLDFERAGSAGVMGGIAERLVMKSIR